jgi:uroporphyrinogen decarboxylase
MTRRERILTALNGGVPDRPPISFDSHGDALKPVSAYYGARDKNDLYAKAGVDGFSVWEWNALTGRYTRPVARLPDDTACDFWGNASQRACGLKACDTVEALARHAWPSVSDFDFSHMRRDALAIRGRDMVVSAGHIGLGYQIHNMLRGNEKALFDLADPAYMEAFMERLSAFTRAYLHALLRAGDGLVEVVRADDDVGTMDRLMISPAMWRRYYKPAWKEAFEIVHAHGARVWFHSCGHVRPLLEDLLEIGVDCWNPFPDYVRGNDHAWLREWRRGRLVLDGGVSHLVLVNGTPRAVAAETRRVLDAFGPDGGLLIGPSQVLTEDMPLKNIIAFFEAAVAYAG